MNYEPLVSVARALSESLVSHPTDLRFEVAESHKNVTVTINGHRDDIGKLMGRECRNVKAIQSILQVLTERHAKCTRVNIAEGWTGQKGDARPAQKELFENAIIRRLGIVTRELFTSAMIQKVTTSTHITLTVLCVPAPTPEIEPSLQTVFKAFGGMNNRFVTIEVVERKSDESVAA